MDARQHVKVDARQVVLELVPVIAEGVQELALAVRVHVKVLVMEVVFLLDVMELVLEDVVILV